MKIDEMMELAQEKLNIIYGYQKFREGQERLIYQILNKQSSLAIMPTGSGKSLCYQIPALILDGVTIVVTPLISLMKDQVDSLKHLGIEATYINSTLTSKEEQERLHGLERQFYKLVYVAPERLAQANFIDITKRLNISLVAIDEAHCLSQWGHDFRPSYRKIPDWIHQLKEKPTILALTATATDKVKNDLMSHLSLDDNQLVSTGYARSNLTLTVLKNVERVSYVLKFLKAKRHSSGIIYSTTRKDVEMLYHQLKKEGISVTYYHGGLSEAERQINQEKFLFDEASIMIATNAFGMGINKSNVRFIIHYQLPRTIEAYYQEAGRAGRDGEESECILLFSPQDIRTQQYLIEQSNQEPDRQAQEYENLQKMIAYCHTDACLSEYILRYFGESSSKPCGKCYNCKTQGQLIDRTKEAQIILSTIKRLRERYGKTMIAQVVVGSSNQKVKQWNLDDVSTYGLLNSWSLKETTSFIDYLIAEQFLKPTNSSYPVLELTNKALYVLKGQQKIEQRIRENIESVSEDDDIFLILKEKRRQLAKEKQLPPYYIFSDKTLKEMARTIPVTEEELMNISGVGMQKLRDYGPIFLEQLQQIKKDDNVMKKRSTPEGKATKKNGYKISVELFLAGKTIEEIANERQLTEITVQNHLLKGFHNQEITSLEQYVEEEKVQQIKKAIEKVGIEKLKPIKELLPADISYQEIRFVVGK
ncbi:putative helicase [Bacillus sp. TS-2]|nr:putative helicase [Bacillus sp. TS-2]